MTNWFIYGILFVFFANFSFAEVPDTIRLEQINIVDKYVPDHTGYLITRIDSVTLNAYKQDNLSTILTLKSPVFIKDYGPGNLASSSFRGANATHTQVLWNGISINSPMLGQSDFAQIPMQMIDEVIVYHGGATVAGNSGAIGGTVNIINNPDWNKNKEINLMQEFGSFGKSHSYFSGQFGNQKIISNTRLIYNTAENDFTYKTIPFEYSDIYVQKHAAYESLGLIEEIYYRLNERSQISFISWFQETFNEIPTTANDESQNVNSLKSKLNYHFFARNWKFKAHVAHLYNYMNYKKESLEINSHNEINTIVSKADITYKAIKKHELNFSTSLQLHQVESNNYSTKHERRELDNSVSFKSLFDGRFNYNVALKNQVQDFKSNRFIPSIGLDLKIFNKLKFQASYNHNYHFPTLNDLYWEFDGNSRGNPELNPEKGYSTEFGLNYAGYKAKLDYSMTGNIFYSQIKDWILWQYSYDETYNLNLWFPENVKNVERKGIELSLEMKYNYNKWKFINSNSYQFVYAGNKESNAENQNIVGKQLIYVPRNVLNSSFTILYNKYNLHFNYMFIDKRYTTTTNSDYLAAYQLINIKIGRTFILNQNIFNFQLGVINAANQDYQVLQGKPMPRRMFSVSLKYSFLSR